MSSASEIYWTTFSITEKDVERVYAHMLERADAARTADLAHIIIAARAREEQERRQRLASQAVLYQPKSVLEPGQRVIFSLMNDHEGTVTAVRDSNNPRMQPFRVATVAFADGTTREFASAYDLPHPLNEAKPIVLGAADESPEEIYARFGQKIERALVARLRTDKEFVEQDNKWLLRGLLTEVNVGFLNIAEAAIEENNASMSAVELARVLELDLEGAKRETTLFSLDYALQRDERFVDVGPIGETRWYLNRLVPAEALNVPRILQFGALPEQTETLPPELETILAELQDDNNADGRDGRAAANVNLILTYPHRRAGSLPLTQGVRALFPEADKALMVTLIDEYGVRIPAWVMPEGNYIFGLKAWYDRNKLNTGALLELVPGAEPLTASIRFQSRREGKSLWVKTAKVESGHLTFGTSQRPVTYKYDEEMLILPDDQNGLDKLTASNYGDRSLDALLMEIFPELVKLNSAGNSIHAKMLYSAANFARRVGARAVFSALTNNEAFTTTGGGYFMLQMAARAV